jgi:hypothetical protein
LQNDTIKNRVWEALTEEFNSQESGVSKRDAWQLKKCWGNIKSRAIRNNLRKRREKLIKLTGGGPSYPNKTTKMLLFQIRLTLFQVRLTLFQVS